jgi:hypothetical protein
MDKDDRQHLEKLRKVLTRRLRVLEMQAARFGGSTPADVILETEDLREKIAEIDAKLPEPRLLPVHVGVSSSEKVLHIVLSVDFSEWKPELQAAALRAFAAVMDVPPDRVKIMDVEPGSRQFELRAPDQAVDRLLNLYMSSNPVIRDLYIESIKERPAELPLWH